MNKLDVDNDFDRTSRFLRGILKRHINKAEDKTERSSKRVHFNNHCEIILIASKEEYNSISDQVWYSEKDIKRFKRLVQLMRSISAINTSSLLT